MKRCKWSQDCSLSGRMVCGEGPDDPLALFLGEAPGYNEILSGRVFIGKAGQELNMYLLKFAKVSRDLVYIENIVRCQPPKNKDPKRVTIELCTGHRLDPLLRRLSPRIIVTMGRFSTQYFLGNVSIERIHGIPRWIELHGNKVILLPIYHPAYGLHSTRRMRHIINDFIQVGNVIRKLVVPVDTPEMVTDYQLVE